MSEQKLDLTSVISTAIKIPGVKVNRDDFLREQFKNLSENQIENIIKLGPVAAGCTRGELKRKSQQLINKDTLMSTGASFLAGIPGGITMAATIPADIVQYYGVALRLAQQMIYLYGEEDIWCDGTPDSERVTNRLILYCGVMLGAAGAAQTVRIMSAALAKQVLEKLPQKALTKTVYYPIIKSILKFFGVAVTKKSFASVVSKAVPIVGGVVSGGITFASMKPMGKRLADTLDKAHFDYDNDDFNDDVSVISKTTNIDVEALLDDNKSTEED